MFTLPLCTADEYYVLSGQHVVEAIRQRAGDYQRDQQRVPPVFKQVSATVLRPDTPLRIRQLAAGDAQAQQGSIRQLSIADFAELLLETQGELDERKRLAEAYRMSGWDRNKLMVCSVPSFLFDMTRERKYFVGVNEQKNHYGNSFFFSAQLRGNTLFVFVVPS